MRKTKSTRSSRDGPAANNRSRGPPPSFASLQPRQTRINKSTKVLSEADREGEPHPRQPKLPLRFARGPPDPTSPIPRHLPIQHITVPTPSVEDGYSFAEKESIMSIPSLPTDNTDTGEVFSVSSRKGDSVRSAGTNRSYLIPKTTERRANTSRFLSTEQKQATHLRKTAFHSYLQKGSTTPTSLPMPRKLAPSKTKAYTFSTFQHQQDEEASIGSHSGYKYDKYEIMYKNRHFSRYGVLTWIFLLSIFLYIGKMN